MYESKTSYYNIEKIRFYSTGTEKLEYIWDAGKDIESGKEISISSNFNSFDDFDTYIADESKKYDDYFSSSKFNPLDIELIKEYNHQYNINEDINSINIIYPKKTNIFYSDNDCTIARNIIYNTNEK